MAGAALASPPPRLVLLHVLLSSSPLRLAVSAMPVPPAQGGAPQRPKAAMQRPRVPLLRRWAISTASSPAVVPRHSRSRAGRDPWRGRAPACNGRTPLQRRSGADAAARGEHPPLRRVVAPATSTHQVHSKFPIK